MKVGMRFHVITLFEGMFSGVMSESIMRRALDGGLIDVDFVNPRDFTSDAHRSVDAPPYGGGPGMVMMAPPLFAAVESVNSGYVGGAAPPVILMSPQGERFTHSMAREFASFPALTIVCGHYEGVDDRFIQHGVDREVSVGDFVLTGGEIAAMAIMDAVSRFVRGVLGNDESVLRESFSSENGGLLEGPVYTRPVEYRGWRVPDDLLSGDHVRVERLRRRMAVERTGLRRPDLLHGWGPVASVDDGSD